MRCRLLSPQYTVSITTNAGQGGAMLIIKTGGIQNYFVEMPLDLVKEGVPNLRRLQA